jgi:predicted transposase/invertase (TIGR01784 family)
MTIHNPHDHFFRDSFGRPEIARNYLEEYLPADLLPLLDLNHLALQDGSFIDENLREHQSDLLYQSSLRDERQPLYLYFLFEHKSYLDELVALQLLRYMLRIWEDQVKQKRPLAPIIPLVVYHGDTIWTIPTDFFSLFNAPETLRPYLLNFLYQINDFSHLSDQEIRGAVWLRVCLSVMRAVHRPDLRHELKPLVELIFALWQQETGIEYVRTIMYYLTRTTGKANRELLKQALLEQGSQGEKVMETIAQSYIQEGIEQGLAKGMEKGMAKGMEKGQLEAAHRIAQQLIGLHDLPTISRITGLSLDEVKTLAKAH